MEARQVLDQLAEDLRFRGLLQRYAASQLGWGPDADDSVQEAFLRAYGFVDRINYPGRTRSIVFFILRKRIATCIGRRIKERTYLQIDDPESAPEKLTGSLRAQPTQLLDILDAEKESIVKAVMESMMNDPSGELRNDIARLILSGRSKEEILAMGFTDHQYRNANYRFAQQLRRRTERRMKLTIRTKAACAV